MLLRVCPSCRNQSTHRTCTYCRRYRAVVGATNSGAAYCADCGPDGEAWHDCPGCGQVVRGVGKGHCRSCINRRSLEQEGRLIAVTLSGSWAVDLLQGFIEWLLERDGGNPKSPAMLRAHAPFFSQLDGRFASAEHVQPQSLLDLFTVAGLRKHQLAAHYVCQMLALEISTEAKLEHVETARVEAILQEAKDSQRGDELFQFNRWLIQSGRPVRTRRLYLSAAASLMRATGVSSLVQLDEQKLLSHLGKVPGSKANLSVVTRFAREQLGHHIEMPKIPRRREPEPKPVAQLRSLLKRIKGAGDHATVEDLQKIVAVAFQIPLRAIKAGVWWPENRQGRWCVVSHGEIVQCPPALQEAVIHWHASVQASSEAR